MLKRLKNLWSLSKYARVTHDEDGSPVLVVDAKPKGKATIIDMTPPVDLFPDHKENL